MKYCLSSRQPDAVLTKADEIKVAFKDNGSIYDLNEKYPDMTIILEIPGNSGIAWNEMFAMADNHKGDFIFALQSMEYYDKFADGAHKWYYDYPLESYYDAVSLKKLGVCYIMAGIPLCFDLENLSKLGVPIRAIPNIAYIPNIPRENGACGQWIRPEDIDTYGQYVDVIEFWTINLEKEATLYHIYAENKEWPGNLNLLIDNLGVNCDNRAIYEELGEKRMNCKQRCMSGGSCHLCEQSLLLGRTAERIASKK